MNERDTHTLDEQSAHLIGQLTALKRELAEAREQIKHHKQAAELNKQEIEKAIPEPPSPQWIAINLLARQRDEWKRAHDHVCNELEIYEERRDANAKRLEDVERRLAAAQEFARYWRDVFECACDSSRPIGGCLRCDLERIAG